MCFAVEMKQVECATCSVLFGITAAFHSRRHEDGVSFYCPNGHSNVYRPSVVEKMRETLGQKELAIKKAGDANAEIMDELVAARRKIAKLSKKPRAKKAEAKHG